MDVKSYYARTQEKPWDVFSLVLSSGQPEKIVPMLKEGYPVTGKLLETLRVLGREDIVDSIALGDFECDGAAGIFLRCFYGEEKYNKLIDEKKSRQEQEKIEKEKTEQKEKDKKLSDMIAEGLNKELLVFASDNGKMSELMKIFGIEAVYAKVCELDCTYMLKSFSDDFLFSRGDFRKISSRYFCYDNELVEKALKYSGGPEEVYALKNRIKRPIFKTEIREMCLMLIKAGHKSLFYSDPKYGFRDLDAIKAMTLDDWKIWKNKDAKAMRKYLRKTKSLLFRVKLAWQLR